MPAICLIILACATAALASPHGSVVVADRGSATLTVIDVETDTPSTVAMPPGMNRPEPMYVVYSPIGHRLFVGDRANNRVIAFRASDLSVEREIPAGAGVFHMWASNLCRQLWVVNDVAKTITVVDTVTLGVATTVVLPVELTAAGGRPHDVILDPLGPYAYVTMIGLPGPADMVLKYSTRSFKELARQPVGKDPHVSLSARSALLYVPCQGSNQVFVLDRRTLTTLPSLAITGAHGAGMSPNGRDFYTTNFPGTGSDGLVAIDTSTNTVTGKTDTPVPSPHNVVVIPNRHKLYVTHSGANNQVSVYSVTPMDRAPRLLTTITTGQNPFGLDFIPRQRKRD